MAAQQNEGIALSHSPLHRYWEPVYEDSMDLIAKLPGIAAAIYRLAAEGQRALATCDHNVCVVRQLHEPDWLAYLPLYGLHLQEHIQGWRTDRAGPKSGLGRQSGASDGCAAGT